MQNYIKVNTILYVEDEKEIREELAEVLENFCETLYLADDGMQGLQQYKMYNPDIIVTDIKMPVMDGVEMSKQIKQIDDEQHIIFTTAFSDIGFFQEAIDLQVDGYILKPIDLDKLEKKIKDIAKKIQMQDELLKKDQMLIQQSKLAAMGEMIGNIAHQWKQPLAVISMQANNLHVDAELDLISKERILETGETLLTQVNYLSKTIDDFRDFFNPANNQSDRFNIKFFIESCINLVKASFDSNMIETIREIDEKINSYGNPNQLSQAIINILNNAKDALKNAQNLQKKLVFILTVKEDDKNNLVITIKDNAGGIPENIIERVFEPYFTTKFKSQGTGLGLYITHTIITENLHGSITVENEVFKHEGETYKGAKFIITLPIAQ